MMGKHASIACLLLYEDYVWVSLGNAMKAKQSKAKQMGKHELEQLSGCSSDSQLTGSESNRSL
jgi:hypothetical protein